MKKELERPLAEHSFLNCYKLNQMQIKVNKRTKYTQGTNLQRRETLH